MRGHRQRALLALLLMNANEVVPAGRVLAELWGEDPPDSGMAAVHVRVSQLRRTLGTDGLIITRHPGYLLRVEPEWIDAWRCERLLARGRAQLSDGDPQAAADTVRQALALWRGSPLADFAGEPFAQASIARLAELRLECWEERIAADLALGNHAEVAGELAALVAKNPLRERLHGQLMLALYRSGRQAEALAHFRDARRMLVQELGIEPGDELRAMEQAILSHDPAIAPPAHPEPARPAMNEQVADERKIVTVLVASLALGPAAAAPVDPEHTRATQSRFQALVTGEVDAAGGSVHAVAGDVVTAVFGAPAAQEDHAQRALRAALALRAAVEDLFGTSTALRAGVATGEVVLGHGAASVSGAVLGTCARLEQAAAPGEIVATARTARAATDAFEFGAHAVVAPVGLPVPVEYLTVVAPATPPRRVASPASALVGREVELDRLREAYRRVATTGRPGLMTVAGDAGLGKSRLVNEFADWLDQQAPAPLRRTGRCVPAGKRTAGGPLREVLLEELGLRETDPAEVVLRKLDEWETPGLALGLGLAVDLHPREARDRLRLAWVDLLTQRTAERPLVLLIEDLHWADDLLVDLLEVAVREVRGRLLLVATGRPEFPQQRPAWGREVPEAGTIWLNPLTAEQTEILVEQLLGGEEVPPPLRALLVDRAEGNPFFAEELFARLLDLGVLVHGATGWEVHGSSADVAVPDSVHSVVAARIDLLPPAEKVALQAASVIGRVFSGGAVQALQPGGRGDLAVLEAREFVRRRPLSPRAGEREFTFKHALTQQVAYETLPKARRARLHAEYAEWLERSGDDGDQAAPLLAHHYAEAVRPQDLDLAWPTEQERADHLRAKALAWLQRAAELAIGRYQLNEGITLLHRALELEDDQPARATLWLAVGHAQALKYDGQAFLTAMEQAIATSRDGAARADIYSELAFETLNRWGMWKRRPDLSQLDRWIEQALDLADPASAARARALIAHAWRHPGDPDAASQALALTERLNDAKLLSEAFEAQRWPAFLRADFDTVATWDRRRFALLSRLTDPADRATVYLNAVPALIGTGRIDEARHHARRFQELAEPLSSHDRLHGIAVVLEVEEAAGDWAAIAALEQRAVRLVEANDDTPCVRNARSLLVCAIAHAYLAQPEHARELAHRADTTSAMHFRPELDPPRLRLQVALRDRAEAQRLLATAPRDSQTWLRKGRSLGVHAVATYLDALAFLAQRARIEEVALPLARPGGYLEPFALRALAVAREEEALLRHAQERFAALGLNGHAAQTGNLLGQTPVDV